ncbi:hypothetical protein ACFL6M_06425 [Candidatus Eisenbacteria bacterium]|uniref:Uncharacterized protein n=1 Tax=Eiseniibacteriota bacterium TaxID=2212470 RepID=A0ABV6YLM3_UNCEI
MTKTTIIEPADRPREDLLGRMAIAVVDLLAHDFDEILLERADHAARDQVCPLGQSAEAAGRITALCRELRAQIQRYERFDRMCRDAEDDRVREDGEAANNLPF